MNMGQDRQMQMVGGNGRNQFRQYAGQNPGNPAGYDDVIRNQVIQNAVQNPRVQNVGNQNGLTGVQRNGNQNQIRNGNLVATRAEGNAAGQNGNQIRCYNCRGVGHYARNCTVRPRRRDAAYLQTQLLIAQKEEAGIQLQAKEYDLMAAAAELDEIEEVNANCILMANLQQASTSGTQTDSAPVYDTDRSAEKMALGYQNPFYLKQAQKKQQSLYDGKVLLEKHDPPVVHDSEEILQLAQESRKKMKQMNKEIKPANYTKINHLSGVFVPQMALSREELYFSNNSKTANVSKSISIPNEDFSDDTTPSVARIFLNVVTITIETHNWSSSAHQELHKIVRDENFPIVNQVDARLQNFKIQFLKEAAKFVGDFKSLANEVDASLTKHKALEWEIEHLQTKLERTKERFKNCIIKKETEYAKLWNDWYKKCDECKYDKISYDKAYKDMQQKIERLQAQLGDLNSKSKDTSGVSDTRNPLSQKLENANVELEFQVLNYARENAHLKATYKNLFDSNLCHVSERKDNTQDTSKNTKFAKQPIVENLPKVGETNALSKPVTSNSVSTPPESKGVNNDKVIAPGMFRINLLKTYGEEKHVPNTVSASARKNPIAVSQPPVITKKD
nr:hypothetical protein [Tanacetum cinerariifolium]